jgi:F-type H+-transporting ATPase subunit a
MKEEGIKFGISVASHIGFSLAVSIFLSAFALLIYFKTRKNKDKAPTGIQNLAEAVIEFLVGQIEPEVGKDWLPIVLPFIGSFFLYIIIANWIGIIPFSQPPTADLSTTFALAVVSITWVHVINFKKRGFVGAIKEWFKPVWWLFILMIPLRFVDNIARILSLSLRLFGNIGGEHLVFEQISHVIPYVMPAALLLLSVLVGLVQAAVFALLNLYYLIEEAGLHGEGH